MTLEPTAHPPEFGREYAPMEAMPRPRQNRFGWPASGKARTANQSWFNRLLTTLLPLAPKPLVKRFAMRYVAGETIPEMLETVGQLNALGASATVDVLGEFIHRREEAEQTAAQYRQILEEIERRQLRANISVKLTALGLLLDESLCLRLMQELCADAAARNTFIRIDMEDSACTQRTIDLYLTLRQTHSIVGIVLQAYLRRTHDDMVRIIESGAGHFRLCKGIYQEPRWLAYPQPDVINANYRVLLEDMIRRGAYVGIATHDERLVWHALKLIRQYGLRRDQYEFQMLLGVDPELRDLLIAAGHHVRIYVPFGREWYGYCMRRLKENPKIAGYILQNLFR